MAEQGRDRAEEAPDSEGWLADFHRGDRRAIEACYRRHGSRVLAAARAVVGPVDAETVTHEVFVRLIDDAAMRASFHGGNFGAWLTQVVTRSAIDALRRRQREVSENAIDWGADIDEELEAKLAIDRFRASILPPELAPLFEARFLRQIPQRDAARELGIPRSTLAYQEQKLRELLQTFLLDGEDS